MLKYLNLKPGSLLLSLEFKEPFKAIVISESTVDSEWRGQVSKWLVNSGCYYMMAYGPDASLWDDEVDMATLKEFDFCDIPESHVVMTTWHEGSLAELMTFAKYDAKHPVHNLDNLLIMEIANVDSGENLKSLYVAA